MEGPEVQGIAVGEGAIHVKKEALDCTQVWQRLVRRLCAHLKEAPCIKGAFNVLHIACAACKEGRALGGCGTRKARPGLACQSMRQLQRSLAAWEGPPGLSCLGKFPRP